MFVRTNILLSKIQVLFYVEVKTRPILFRSFCLYMYDIGLWKVYNKGTLNRFRYCYHKCLKIFFNYRRTGSVTDMLFTLKLPSVDTILHNGKQQFLLSVLRSGNNLIDTVRVLF